MQMGTRVSRKNKKIRIDRIISLTENYINFGISCVTLITEIKEKYNIFVKR